MQSILPLSLAESSTRETPVHQWLHAALRQVQGEHIRTPTHAVRFRYTVQRAGEAGHSSTGQVPPGPPAPLLGFPPAPLLSTEERQCSSSSATVGLARQRQMQPLFWSWRQTWANSVISPAPELEDDERKKKARHEFRGSTTLMGKVWYRRPGDSHHRHCRMQCPRLCDKGLLSRSKQHIVSWGPAPHYDDML